MESYIPFETILNEDGYSYHLIYGKHLYGYYLVIPDWNIGCEMSHYNDVFWNKESLIKAGLSVKKASIISVRLKEMIERKN